MPEAIKTLQRALEREVEKEGSLGLGGPGVGVAVGAGVPVGEMEGRRATMPTVVVGGTTPTVDVGGLGRRQTIASAGSKGSKGDESVTESGTGSGSGSEGWRAKDTLDREFIESGIDALRRVSNGPDVSLPSWTITK
jgi:abelson tyrosine-protein kinase 1